MTARRVRQPRDSSGRPVGRAGVRAAVRLLAVAIVVVSTGCGDRPPDPAETTRTSAAALEEGQRRLAAGDFAAARESFAAAADGGGLQPDFYCEARLQQAWCAAQLGDLDAATTLLDALAAGAPDLDRIDKVRAFIRSRRSAGGPAGETDTTRDAAPGP